MLGQVQHRRALPACEGTVAALGPRADAGLVADDHDARGQPVPVRAHLGLADLDHLGLTARSPRFHELEAMTGDRRFLTEVAHLFGGWYAVTRDGVCVAVSDSPFAIFAAINLRGTKDVAARFAIHRCRRVLEPGCERHVTAHIAGLNLEAVRGAISEHVLEHRERLFHLLAAIGIAHRAEDADRLTPRPQCPSRVRVPGVQRDLRCAQWAVDPSNKFVSIAHSLDSAPRDRGVQPERRARGTYGAWRVEVVRTRGGEVFRVRRRAVIGAHGGRGWARIDELPDPRH